MHSFFDILSSAACNDPLNRQSNPEFMSESAFQPTPILDALELFHRTLALPHPSTERLMARIEEIQSTLLEQEITLSKLDWHVTSHYPAPAKAFWSVFLSHFKDFSKAEQMAFLDFLDAHPSTSFDETIDLKESGSSMIHRCAEFGLIDALHYFVAKGFSVESVDSKGCKPIHIATRHNQQDTLNFLMQHGASITALNADQQNIVHYASSNGYASILAFILNQPGTQDMMGQCSNKGLYPLHCAAQYGHIECMELLLNYGADINIQSFNDSSTALHHAISNSSEEGFEFLLQHEASLSLTDSLGNTPLNHAISIDESGAPSFASRLIHEHLKRDTESLWEQTLNGNTALHLSIQQELPQLLAQLLAIPKAPVDMLNHNGASALHWAAGSSDSTLAQLLLEHGADVNGPAGSRNEFPSPLSIALRKHQLNTAEILLKHRVNLNIREHPYGSIHYALDHHSFSHQTELALWLIDHNFPLTTPDRDGVMPLHKAARQGSIELIEKMLQAGATLYAPTQTPAHQDLTDHPMIIYSQKAPQNGQEIQTFVKGLLLSTIEKHALQSALPTPRSHLEDALATLDAPRASAPQKRL